MSDDTHVRTVVRDELASLDATARLTGTWTKDRGDYEKTKVEADQAVREGRQITTLAAVGILAALTAFLLFNYRPTPAEHCAAACGERGMLYWQAEATMERHAMGAGHPDEFIAARPEICTCHP